MNGRTKFVSHIPIQDPRTRASGAIVEDSGPVLSGVQFHSSVDEGFCSTGSESDSFRRHNNFQREGSELIVYIFHTNSEIGDGFLHAESVLVFGMRFDQSLGNDQWEGLPFETHVYKV